MSQKKKVAIIGGGTGLSLAWLLADNFDVTLYEASDRLGGHIQSLNLTQSDGKNAIIEAGTEFINPTDYKNFYKLLELLKVEFKSYTMKMEFIDYTKRDNVSKYEKTLFSPGVTDLIQNYSDIEKKLFSEGCCSCVNEIIEDTSKFGNLFLLQYIIYKYNKMKDSLKNKTTKEFIDSLDLVKKINKNFGPEFFYPFTNASWGIDYSNKEGKEPRDAEDFMAFYTLYYIAAGNTYQEVVGGLSKYIDKLYEKVKNICNIKLHSEVTEIREQTPDKYKVTYNDKKKGDSFSDFYDEVIICTSCEIASKLIKYIPKLNTLAQKLNNVTYYTTKICIHESFDKDFDKDYVVHIKYTGKRASLHINKQWNSNLVRSWCFDNEEPENTLETVYYRHPNMNRTYYDAQELLKEYNNKNLGIYFGGICAGFNDSHESAMTANISIAKILSQKYSTKIQNLDLFQLEKADNCCNCSIQ